MPKLSAGLLVYRLTSRHVLELLIVHPGGPFWAKKDEGAWSIPKGEYEEGDDAFKVALREFEEELGQPAPEAQWLDLGEVRQPSGKRVHCWAGKADVDISTVASNTFEMEWPPRSGKMQSFPEVDDAAWLPAGVARRKLLKGHVGFVDQLVTSLSEAGVDVSEGETEPEASNGTLF